MPTKLKDTLEKVRKLDNSSNSDLLIEFYEYLRAVRTSERYQSDILKVLIKFSEFIDDNLINIQKKEQIIAFLNTKIKDREEDPDERWITTWNDYLWRIKYFYRWIYNIKKNADKQNFSLDPSNWITPEFVHVNKIKTKRLSPYLESELWDKEEIVSIIKYEPYTRNKAIIMLMWDLNARPHEITLLKIKHIRLKERYGEGEVPHEAKTGSGPILLTASFPYVRDCLNEHPFKHEPNARLICNLQNGAPIHPDAIWTMMKQLRKRISRLLESESIEDQEERNRLDYLVKRKRWNPYCFRHSSITHDSDFLPDFALKKKVRWSMNSKQGARYIKRRMGEDLKNQILARNGIISEVETKQKPSVHLCARCEFVNGIDNKYCSKCSYPLTALAYEEIKIEEDKRIKLLEEKQQEKESEIQTIKEQINSIFTALSTITNQNQVNETAKLLYNSKILKC
ncbi:MAG: Integrase [Nitrososphaeraceae archaeon]|nr:Integrase [Nitrososphaeraceae archaeon]